MRSRSIFWPLVMVAAGVIFLGMNLGSLPSSNLWALYYVIPFVLIALGLGLIVSTRWAPARQIVSALVVGAALLAFVFAAPLGWNAPPKWGTFWGGFPLQGLSWALGGGGAIKGSGVDVSETRTVPDFSAGSVDFPAAVTIQQGGTQSVVVVAEDNLQPQLSARVSNGVLYIGEREIGWGQRVYPTKPVQINLVAKDLQRLSLSSAGTVEVEGLSTKALGISISGAGLMTLAKLNVQNLSLEMSGVGTATADGAAEGLSLDVSGAAGFHGDNLSVQSAQVNISGMGSSTLWVVKQLTANISGSGSVSYFGSPSVYKDISGLGSIHPLGDK